MEFKKQPRPRRPLPDTPQRSTTSVGPRPVQLQPVSIKQQSPSTQPDSPNTAKKESKKRRLPRVNKKLALLIVAVIIIAITVTLLTHDSSSDSPSTTAVKPAYETTLPKGKSIDDLGGWKRVSPANDDPVFAYTDKIDDVLISVSQQPLPKSFKSDVKTSVAEMAKKFNATDKIDAAGITAYIGTSSKGPQSVIFAHNDLLILMKSVKQINDTSWAHYIETLK